MRNLLAAVVLATTFCTACSTVKKTPHEQYAKKLDKTDLEETPAGRQWLAAAKTALEDAQAVELPYRHNGYFGPDKPRALGLKFIARHGERLIFTLAKRAPNPLVLYIDFFQQKGTETSLLFSAPKDSLQFSFEVEEPGSYILRLQPELFRSGEYSLSVSVGPSIGFPVLGGKAKVGSFWGASRSGGKRRHEGIDIFAPKRTPVVAGADGVVTAVKEEKLGGKVVWLRLLDKNITLYYAHLDQQLVQPGQVVKKGETLGLVGNTGNARYTGSHLHFGIYTSTGPIDPFPFVNPLITTAPAAPVKKLSNYLQLTRLHKADYENGVVKTNTLLIPVAVSVTGYIAELPNGKMIQVPFASVQSVALPVKRTEAVAGNAGKGSKR